VKFNPRLIGTNRLHDIGLKGIHALSHSLGWRVAPRYYAWQCHRDVLQYDNSIDPFEVHYVDPHSIEEITRRPIPFFNERWALPGAVKSGDWDRRSSFVFEPGYEKKEYFRSIFSTVRYDDSLFHQALVRRFDEGIDWFDTEYVNTVLDFIEQGQAVWHGCRTHKEVQQRCQYVEELLHSIERRGYKSQQELGKDFKSVVEQEVMVDVDRDGNFLFVDGRHRLSIAKILDIKEIPVVVGTRHKQLLTENDTV